MFEAVGGNTAMKMTVRTIPYGREILNFYEGWTAWGLGHL